MAKLVIKREQDLMRMRPDLGFVIFAYTVLGLAHVAAVAVRRLLLEPEVPPGDAISFHRTQSSTGLISS